MFVVSGCEGGHLNGQPNALNDHHHHQYQSRANLRQEVRHNDRDGVSLGRVRDIMLVQWSISREVGELLSCAMLKSKICIGSDILRLEATAWY